MTKRTVLRLLSGVFGFAILVALAVALHTPTDPESILKSQAAALASEAKDKVRAPVVKGELDPVAKVVADGWETINQMLETCRKLPGDPSDRLHAELNTAFKPLGYTFEDHSRPGSQGTLCKTHECPVVIYKEGKAAWVLSMNFGKRLNDGPDMIITVDLREADAQRAPAEPDGNPVQ